MANVYITVKDGKSQLTVDGSLDLFGEFLSKMRTAIRAGDYKTLDDLLRQHDLKHQAAPTPTKGNQPQDANRA